MPEVHIFGTTTSETRFGWTTDPSHLGYWGVPNLQVFTRPLSIQQAFRLLAKLGETPGLHNGLQVMRTLRRLGIKDRGFPQNVASLVGEQFPKSQIVSIINNELSGRLLPLDDAVKHLTRKGFAPREVQSTLEYLAFHQKIRIFPAITQERWGNLRCGRCNGTQIITGPCPTCRQGDCLWCIDCDVIGSLRGCSLLVSKEASRVREKLIPDTRFKFPLTCAQQSAASELVDLITKGARRVLVWAACGAGKTEVTFAVIAKCLSHGGRVLFAIPRKDPLLQLADRIVEHFPTVHTTVHYGGKPSHSWGDMVLATTHQVLRFREAFHLAILDEVDAFPYQGTEMLRFGLEKSLTRDGQLIEMTATPTKIPRNIPLVTIPARHHGRPLPIPQLIRVKLAPPQRIVGKKLPNSIRDYLQLPKPWIVFVPTVDAAELVAAWLERHLRRVIYWTHSRDAKREEKVGKFYQSGADIIVATSILERGITLSGVQVMVLYADHGVYSAGALVQMAGRVGRTSEQPEGNVVFAASKRTSAMLEAVKQINFLNTKARQRGLLRV